jgi:GT2 family glycosyltransferase
MSISLLSIIIVNYNGAKFIPACIDSILKSKTSFPYEIIVIDNMSSDDSIDVLKTYGDTIKLIESKENLGFSQGNNVASRDAVGDYYFLLNNDTVINESTLQILVDYLIDKPKVGAITPKLLNEDGSLQAPGSIFGSWKFKSTVPVKVPFIAGAAVLMKKSVYEKMGGLDANLFFYNDDIDMCKVLYKLNYEIHYVPTANLIHIGGLSTKFRKIGSLIEGYRGGMYVCYKHYGVLIYSIYRVLVLFDIIPRLVGHLLLSLLSSTSRKMVKAYLEVIRIDIMNDIFLIKD